MEFLTHETCLQEIPTYIYLKFPVLQLFSPIQRLILEVLYFLLKPVFAEFQDYEFFLPVPR